MFFAHTVPRSGDSQDGFEQMLEDIKKFRHHEFFYGGEFALQSV